ncbi:MAG: hypothetical protein II892_13750 [Fibrobacter sp.]|nr:hypothetical protein [Fibrobacter sp.]MBR0126180.1 hypothetical protein [Treponema sp.]
MKKKKIKYPADFPVDLYFSASERTKKFVDKWVHILTYWRNYKGSNNIQMNIDFWNQDHPDDTITIKSFYRNRKRLEQYGWKAFFVHKNEKLKKKTVEPPFTDDEIRRIRKILALMESQASA